MTPEETTTQPHIPAHDGDSAHNAETASAPSYPQCSTAQDHSATQELLAAQDATRETPSVTTIPAPPVGTALPVSAPATPAVPGAPAILAAPVPSAQEAPAPGNTYSALSGGSYGEYAAPVSPDAFAPPIVVVTKKGLGRVALLGTMFLTIGLTLGAVFYARSAMLRASTPTNPNGGTVAIVPVSNGSGTDWTDVAAAVSPVVVTIQTQDASSGGTGSDVVYDAQDDIVTNYHVIASALGGGQIQVTPADGRLYGAVAVGHDKTTDLAVIRLENPPSDLTVACFATSANLEVGAPAMAIGTPLGLSNTVTTGIVSALNRPVEVLMDESATSEDGTQASSDLVATNVVQIDASINPGNSGGPLFDASSAVTGISSSIKSLSSSFDGQTDSIGLGFAIPSDLIVSIADQFIASGSASHGMFSTTVKAAITTVDSDTYVGAEVQDVSADSGTSTMGICAGDVIVKVEGQEVTSPKQLTGYVRRYKADDTVTTTIVCDSATQDVSVRIQ